MRLGSLQQFLHAAAAAGLIVFLPLLAYGFLPLSQSVNTGLYHSYEGLVCTDCHTLHNSENGVAVATASPDGTVGPYPRLLKRPTTTDICIGCHFDGNFFEAPPVITATDTLPGYASPAGNFYWSNVDPKKGHNPGKSLGVQARTMRSDPVLTVSPGGTFSTQDWDCTTCHDPHDRFGANVAAWRQLKRKINGIVHTGNETVAKGVESYGGDQGPTTSGYEPILSNSRGDIRGGVNDTNYVNTRKDGNPLEGANLTQLAESDTNKNVYRGGFSSFCAVCHGNFHGGGQESRISDNGKTRANGAWIRHPTNVTMDNATGSKYWIGTYSARITNSQGTSPNPVGYDWKYPMVKGDADFSVKVTVPSADNAATLATMDRIMCLTCHKAHATQYENMTRWDSKGHAFIANGAADFTGSPSNGDNPAYGCGKCHQKGGTAAYIKVY